MFQMEVSKDGQNTVLYIEGSLKTSDAEEFGHRLMEVVQQETVVKIDMENTEFICSAVLRALLAAQAVVDDSGDKEMVLRNVNEEIYEVLTMTGFVNILTVE